MKFHLYYMLSPDLVERQAQVIAQFEATFSTDWQLRIFNSDSHVAAVAAGHSDDSYMVIAESNVDFTPRMEAHLRRAVTHLSGEPWDITYTDLDFENAADALKRLPSEELMRRNDSIHLQNLHRVAYTGSHCYIVNKWAKHRFLETIRDFDPARMSYDRFLADLVRRDKLNAFVLYPFASARSDRITQPQKPMTIVLSRLDAIGDMVCTTAAIRSVRKSWPHAHIALVCNPYNAVVMKRSPDVDELYVVESGNTTQLAECARHFHGADIAIAFAPRAEDLNLIGMTEAKERVGYTYLDFNAGILVEHNLTKMLVPSAYPAIYNVLPGQHVYHEVEQNLNLVEAAGGDISKPEMHVALADEDYQIYAHIPEGFILVPLAPKWFSNGSTQESLLLLLRSLRNFGRPLVLTFDERCAVDAQPIIDAEAADFVIGDAQFLPWAALIARAACIVTVNTSATHLASALKTPMLLLHEHGWFWVDRQKWGPYATDCVEVRKPVQTNDESLAASRKEIMEGVAALLKRASIPQTHTVTAQ